MSSVVEMVFNWSVPDPPHPSCASTPPTARFALGIYGGVSGRFALTHFAQDASARNYLGNPVHQASCVGADFASCIAAVTEGHADLQQQVIEASGGQVDTFIFSSTSNVEIVAKLLALYRPVAARFDAHYRDVWQPAFQERAASHGHDGRGKKMLERHESRWQALANVLRLILEAGEARREPYARIYLTRPDIALWRPVDLRRYCDDTFYLNNCFPPVWRQPCLADFHFVMTTPMAQRLADLPSHLGNSTGRLVLLTQQIGNASNTEFVRYILRHVAARWAPDHVVAMRHEEVWRKADGKLANSKVPFRTRYEQRPAAPSDSAQL